MRAVAVETTVMLTRASIGAAGDMCFIMRHPAAIHDHVAPSTPIAHRKGRAVVRKACTCVVDRMLCHLDAGGFTSLNGVFVTKKLHDLVCGCGGGSRGGRLARTGNMKQLHTHCTGL